MSGTAHASARPPGLPDYRPEADVYDEAFADFGSPRPHYEQLMGTLGQADPELLRQAANRAARRRKVRFGASAGVVSFVYDPVPRILTAAEWDELERGLVQRVRALNAFIADVYGERRMVAAGRVPARVVEAADHYEPSMQGVPVPGGAHAAVAGLDLVRGADGRFMVLEDNLRTPSGIAYAVAAREVMADALPEAAHEDARRIDGTFEVLGRALRAAAPGGEPEPMVVLLSDGPRNSAWYEHETLAARLAIPVVTLGDLSSKGGALQARLRDGRSQRVHVVYRRTDVDQLADRRGRPTDLAQALVEPTRRGLLSVVNAFGAGVADDKLVHAYVEEMVRFFLDEEPVLASVPTYDLAEQGPREAALERLDELVVKPRSGFGGHGVVICAHAMPEDVKKAAEAIRARPERFIAQETVRLSSHPTVAGSRIEPRHVDLRPFIISGGDEVTVVPGGLTRVAFDPGAMVVNSSQNGGAKDTWVLP